MPLRYFLLREVSFGQDGSYSPEAIVNRVNSELANSFGNLAQRSLSMIFKNLDGVLPAAGEADEDKALLGQVERGLRHACRRNSTVSLSRRGSRRGWPRCSPAMPMSTRTAPWALKKTDPERMAAVLGTLVVAVRKLAAAVQPVIPASAEKLIALIDSGKDGAPIAQPTPIFPRLELGEEEETRREADR